ncbi:hypothetical protein [Branchiibius cervicis]|uniref:Uncharacterized protein n=1 Tax=Branchiibius cervicis TaxID=908252 RepID=A0ABW2AVD4_9MICO
MAFDLARRHGGRLARVGDDDLEVVIESLVAQRGYGDALGRREGVELLSPITMRRIRGVTSLTSNTRSSRTLIG